MKIKRALLLLTLMVMTLSAVTGGTIAWFTDTVESSANNISAGNLDIELYKDSIAPENKVDKETTVFTVPERWEPGAVSYQNLVIANTGNLHLNYRLGINFGGQNYVVDAEGNTTEYDLTDVLKVAIVNGGVSGDREQVLAAAKDAGSFALNSAFAKAHLAPAGNTDFAGIDDTDTIGIVIYWEPSAQDNNWNVNNGKTTTNGQPLNINLGISLTATQKDAEADSFGSDYDVNAGAGSVVDPEAPTKPSDWLSGVAAVMYGGDDPMDKTPVKGEVVAEATVDTILFENAVIKEDTVITLKKDNTVGFNNVELIIPEGGLVVDNQSGSTTVQILMANTTINGVLVTDSNKANFAKYFKNIEIGNVCLYNDPYNWINTDNVYTSENVDKYSEDNAPLLANKEYKAIVYANEKYTADENFAYITATPNSSAVNVYNADIAAKNVFISTVHCNYFIEDASFTIPEGGKLIINKYTSQVFLGMEDVTINGKPIKEFSDLAPYLEGSVMNMGIEWNEYNVHNTNTMADAENAESLKTPLPSELFDNGADGLNFNGEYTAETLAYVDYTFDTIALYNVTVKADNVIVAAKDNTIIIHDANFILPEGGKLVTTVNGATVGQVMIHNVTVNGELLTQETAKQYLQGVNWYEVW